MPYKQVRTEKKKEWKSNANLDLEQHNKGIFVMLLLFTNNLNLLKKQQQQKKMSPQKRDWIVKPCSSHSTFGNSRNHRYHRYGRRMWLWTVVCLYAYRTSCVNVAGIGFTFGKMWIDFPVCQLKWSFSQFSVAKTWINCEIKTIFWLPRVRIRVGIITDNDFDFWRWIYELGLNIQDFVCEKNKLSFCSGFGLFLDRFGTIVTAEK